MRIDKNAEPDSNFITENLAKLLSEHQGNTIYVTQGFICRNIYGEIDNLVFATGHFRNGILLAPVTAEIVAGGILGA